MSVIDNSVFWVINCFDQVKVLNRVVRLTAGSSNKFCLRHVSTSVPFIGS